ncbi:MAG TPA: four helix bundle protein [Thermodesulfobacteriota bacterium]|nr:four helix bundle protein [Thermodesulfobacteriota bacterium]
MKINRFEDLECWQEARKLVAMVYRSIKSDKAFQSDYRLRDQSTGAAISIMNNISEGWASQSNADFIRFLTYSRRSCAEVQNCFYVALDQEYVNENTHEEAYEQAKRVIYDYRRFIKILTISGAQRKWPPKTDQIVLTNRMVLTDLRSNDLNGLNDPNELNDLNDPNELNEP